MVRRLLDNNKGMALLITIMVISLLVAVTVQFSRGMRQAYITSATSLDGWRQQLAAGSGIQLGCALLEKDGLDTDSDTLLDEWSVIDPELFQGLFEGSMLVVEIVDLNARIQVNSLVADSASGEGGNNQNNANENREILKQLLLSGNFDIEGEEVAREVVDALVDWLDGDDRESDFGAESSYYRSLKNPYECRNGPVSAIEELLLVKGMTPELLFGTDEKLALADYLSVYGEDGTININTVDEELLKAMVPQVDTDIIDGVIEYRLEEGNRELLKEKNWYKSVPGWPGDVELSENLITTGSGYFWIRASASFGDLVREVAAVVMRDEDNRTHIVYRTVE